MHLASCTSSSNSGAIVSSARPSSSFEVVAPNVFADHLDIFYMYAEMGNDKRTEMQLMFQDLPSHSVFVTTPKAGGTGLKLTAANHAVITQKWRVLNEQRRSFAWVVRLRQTRVPHTWLLNTGPSGYDYWATDHHQPPGVAQMTVLHGLMSWPNITTSMIYRILESGEDHTKQPPEHGDIMRSDSEDEW